MLTILKTKYNLFKFYFLFNFLIKNSIIFNNINLNMYTNKLNKISSYRYKYLYKNNNFTNNEIFFQTNILYFWN